MNRELLPSVYHLRNPFKDTLNSGLMASAPEDFDVLSDLGPNVKVYDNVLYAYDILNEAPTLTEELASVTASLNQLALLQAVSLRQILVYTTLISCTLDGQKLES